jgi:hypothetical protein
MTFTRTTTAPKGEKATIRDTAPAWWRPSRDDIARLAYHYFEARGREEGRDLEDWISAERELSRPFGGAA